MARRREYCVCRTHPDPPCDYCERQMAIAVEADERNAPIAPTRPRSDAPYRALLQPADEGPYVD